VPRQVELLLSTDVDPHLHGDAACSSSGKSLPDVDSVDLSNQDWTNAGKFLFPVFKERW